MFRATRSIVATFALAAMVAACSGTAGAPSVASLQDPGASGGPAASPSPSAVTPQDAALAYARCMRANGVDMPDPVVSTDGEGGVSIDQSGPGGAPVSKDKMQKADEACHHFMDEARPAAGPPLSPEDLDKMLAFAQCMREHGIPMDDPTADGGIRIQIGSTDAGSGAAAPPINEQKLQAAHTACSSLLPGKMADKMGQPGKNSVGGAPAGGGTVTEPAPKGTN